MYSILFHNDIKHTNTVITHNNCVYIYIYIYEILQIKYNQSIKT